MALDRVSGPLASAINLHQSGHLDKAIKGYLEILEQDPAQADANHLVGVALLSRGVGDDRVQMFSYLSKAVELRPEVAEFHNDLGNAYWVKRRFEQAESAFNQCVMLKPRFVRGYFNLGNARLMQRKFVAAADAYRQCIAQDSNWAQAHYNLGNCLQQLGELDAAMAAYNQAISLKENYHDAYLARSTVLLKQGDYFQGWRDYEHRLSSEEYIILSKSGKSWWRGQAFPGQTLLVYAELRATV